MKKTLLFCFLVPLTLFSQGEFNNWHFGEGLTFNFNSGSPVVGTFSQVSSSNSEGTASVSDCEGNLLFYTSGQTVWNKSNNIMSNGTGLNGVSPSVFNGTYATQGALIVKRPETSGIYYIFTSSQAKGLYYSIVNMNLNSGLGAVIIKNTLLSTNKSEKLAVTYHSNGKDIWVVTHYGGSNQYESFLVTRTGVAASSVSSFDGVNHNDTHGDLKISRDGKKIGAVVDFKGVVYLGDFNNSTGVVSNTASLGGFASPHGVEFSPNSSKMYINSNDSRGVIQFSLIGTNSQSLSSDVTISNSGNIYGSLQLGPDDLIYVTTHGSSYIGVINNPDAFGSSANYINNAVSVGGNRAGYELTNVTLISPNSFNGPNTVLFNSTCANDITKFSLGVETDVVDVLWEFGDPNSILKNYSTKMSPEHQFTSVGTYYGKVVINYSCGKETINFTVIISEAPVFNLPDKVVCSGAPTNIGISGISNSSYLWTPSTGLNSNTISNPTLTISSSVSIKILQYNLTVTNNSSSCSSSQSMRVTMANAQVDAGPDIEMCSGDTVQIGSPDTSDHTYSWSPSINVFSPNSSLTDVVVFNNTEISVTNVYTLTATYLGCVSTDQVSLTVKPLPKINLPKDTTICSLDSIVLNVNGNQNATYMWSTAEGLNNTTAVSPNFAISNKDTEIVEYLKFVEISNNGCTYIDTVSIKVNPQAGVDDYQYLCPGFGVELSPFGKGVNFLWTPNQDIDNVNIKNPTVNPSSSITYYLNVTDVYGCSYLDSVFVDVNPVVPLDLGPDTVICRDDTILIGSIGHPLNAIYTWLPNKFLSNPDSNYTFTYPDSTLSYFVTSQSDTCFGYDTIQVKVNQLPNVVLESDSSICFRDSIYLVVTGAQNYTWTPNSFITTNNDSAYVFPHDTIDYIVRGVDTNSCVSFDTVTVSVRPLPIINLTPDSSVCLTDSIQVTAKGGGTYSWFPSEFVNDDTLSNPFLIPNKDTRFIVTVIGENNCTENDTVDVIVHALPVIAMTSDTIICDGTKAYLWATGGVQYKWSPEQNLNASNISNPVSSTTVAETYQVIVIDGNNCIDSLSTNVGVNVTPEADFDYSFIASCPGFDVDFTDKSANMDSWNWIFGDGAVSLDKSPNHVYEFGKSVTTTLIVGNNSYCFDTATVNFDWKKLEDYIKIEAPNIITPNGNKVNDCFEVKIEGDFDDCTKIEVFNRWGMKVYDNQEFDTCFKGVNEYNFQELTQGTYFYVITVNDYIKNGFIHIAR
ncbi:MAG: gliding motility-associated-like protein [Saprospiraceae bacterium]|jgi:gliding motility-associated-like protein